MNRMSLVLVLCGFVALCLITAPPGFCQTKTTYITIGTTSMGSPLYAAGNVLAQQLNKSLPNVKASARVTAGTLQNIELLARKTIEISLGDSVNPVDAYNGVRAFVGKKDPLIRGVMCIWPAVVYIVVPNSVNSMADLKGKRFAIGARGSVGTRYAEVALASAGLTFDDVKPEHVSWEEGKEFLQDGHVGAGLFMAEPNALVTELLSSGRFKILEITGEEMKKIKAKEPTALPHVVKANLYPNQPKPVNIFKVPNYMISRETVDPDLIYQVTKVVFEDHKDLVAGHKVWGMVKLETALEGMSLPIHAGAIRYYKEKGIAVGGK
jgi:TRAP transporter TAXI family solute receptor